MDKRFNLELFQSDIEQVNLDRYIVKFEDIVNDITEKSGLGETSDQNPTDKEIFSQTIFDDFYNQVQNILFPFPNVDDDENFLYCLYFTGNPLDLVFDPYAITIGSKVYTFTFKTDHRLFSYVIIMFLIFCVRRFVNKTSTNQSPDILPDKLLSIKDIDPFVTAFPVDSFFSCYYLVRAMAKLDIHTSYSSHAISDKMFSRHFETLVNFHTNIIAKIIYSTITLLMLVDHASSFVFESSSREMMFVHTSLIPELKSQTIVNAPSFLKKYSSIQSILSYQVDELPASSVHKSSMIKWDVFFDFLPEGTITKHNIFIEFNNDVFLYVYPFTGYLDMMFELFYIRGDEVFMLNEKTVAILFRKSHFLFARSKLYPIQILPGDHIDKPISPSLYSKVFAKFYKTNPNTILTYINHGDAEYKLSNIKEIKDVVTRERENTLLYIYNHLLSRTSLMRVYQIFYLLLVKSITREKFTSSIFSDVPLSDLNKYLFLYVCSYDVVNQILPDDKKFLLDANELLTKIEFLCNDVYNKLKQEDDLDSFYHREPGCICSYIKYDDITPSCFDQRCKSAITMENFAIARETTCKIPFCENDIDLQNIVSFGNVQFLDFAIKTKCGVYNIIDNFTHGYYNISFILPKEEYIWRKKNSEIIIEEKINNTNYSKDDFLFEIIPVKSVKSDYIIIKDLYFDRSQIIRHGIGKQSLFNIGVTDSSHMFLISNDPPFTSPVTFDKTNNHLSRKIPYLRKHVYKGIVFVRKR